MKWEQDLIKDIRFNSKQDDDEWGSPDPTKPPINVTWQECSDCNRITLHETFLSVRDSCTAILEIGISRNGPRSFTRVFLDNKKKDTIYVGIDVDDKTYLDSSENSIYTIRNSSSDYQNNIDKIKTFGVEKFDFIFIDGWHSINQVLDDWEYTNLLSDWGVVGFHDINHHLGPMHFINNMNEDIWQVEKRCPDDWGIGFVWKKR